MAQAILHRLLHCQDISILITQAQIQVHLHRPLIIRLPTNLDLVAADFNGDGKPDIATGSTNDNTFLLITMATAPLHRQ